MLYDINFIIGLLITLLLFVIVSFYFTQKIDEQNEKIGAISMVVRAMADELNFIKTQVISSRAFVQSNRDQSNDAPTENIIELLPEYNYNDSENQKSINLATIGDVKDIELINVSDDNTSSESESDDEDDNDSEEEDGEESEDDNDSEEEKYEEVNELDVASDSDHSDDDNDDDSVEQTKVIKIGGDGDDATSSSEELKSVQDELEELESMQDELELEELVQNNDFNFEDLNQSKEEALVKVIDIGDEALNMDNILSHTDEINDLSINNLDDLVLENSLKKINISLEAETEKAYTLDFKKMSLNQLRSVVVEKHLCADASKLKKQDLFKLLNVN